MRWVGKIVYWLAVLAVSIVLLIVLIRFFESRDSSEIEEGSKAPAGQVQEARLLRVSK